MIQHRGHGLKQNVVEMEGICYICKGPLDSTTAVLCSTGCPVASEFRLLNASFTAAWTGLRYSTWPEVSPRLCGTNVLNVAWEGREGKLENAAYATQRWGYIRNDIRQSLYKLLCDLSLERLACSRFVLCN